jgi:hypothetical protein
MESGGELYVQDVLDEIEAEIAGSAVIPLSGQVALNAARMAALAGRLKRAVASADASEGSDARHLEARRRAEAEAVLTVEEARRQAELLLEGGRVSRLREEHVQAIINERRDAGEVQVKDAYSYGLERMRDALRRAEGARRLVHDARDKVALDEGGLAQATRGLLSGLFGRRKRPNQ